MNLSINKRIKRNTALIVCLMSLLNNPAIAGESTDWRTDYKAMVGSFYTGDYDSAIVDARTCLDKVTRLTNQTEKKVALDELIKYLNMIGGRNGQQQNYAQQELVLKCKLKANEIKYADDSSVQYQVAQIRKDLATCLVLQGKSKEAEEYLTEQEKPHKTENLTGWKKDIDLLTDANRGRRLNSETAPDKLCEYAANAVNEILTIKNPTEKEVAVSQITQQLGTAEFRYKNNKDYPHEEKILKLQLKMQAVPGTDSDYGIGLGYPLGIGISYQRINTLKELVTCLVMEDKNDEAAEYDKTYKEESDKVNKNQQQYMKTIMDKVAPVVQDKENKTIDKKE